ATGRTALRQSAAVAMEAAQTPGLDPSIADPMRIWSLGASKLLVKMGLRIPGDSLNSTATEMNAQAEQVQQACANAGTHAEFGETLCLWGARAQLRPRRLRWGGFGCVRTEVGS